ncbi:small multidrug resistance pump [Paenibacillus forsythiae]|uniref:Small multidrug resistance pump n=1 Tax=Paenibacillus forsythiae TaxID=365616 RepID=A0ABU3H3J0_9BACL|nr:multidrug efflux SMR transporter [Paenibacillus forsythiae]MDT3425392.1 small multidrug resistance pump [Paenibacillus forsythiae]
MHWFLLILAIAAEVAGTTFMKLSAGFTRPVPSVLLIVCYLLSLSMLNLALKGISVSAAYAIWSGVGTAFVAGIGWALFGEQITAFKAVCIVLIIAGVVGLNLNEGSRGKDDNPGGQVVPGEITALKEKSR